MLSDWAKKYLAYIEYYLLHIYVELVDLDWLRSKTSDIFHIRWYWLWAFPRPWIPEQVWFSCSGAADHNTGPLRQPQWVEGRWKPSMPAGMERNAIWPVLLLLSSGLLTVHGLVGVEEVDRTCQSHETCMPNCAFFKVMMTFDSSDRIF